MLIEVKKVDNYDDKKLFIIVMSNDIPKRLNDCENFLEKYIQYHRENKERLQKMARDRYKAFLKK